jgi:hypothetical protein
MADQLSGLAVGKDGKNLELIVPDPADTSKGTMRTAPVGALVKDSWSNTSGTVSFTTPRYSILITNDGNANVTLVVNSLTFTIKPTETFDEKFDPFTSVSITTTSTYRGWARG